MGIVLEKYVVTVVVNGEEMQYTLYASSKKDAERHAICEYGKSNVKNVERA